MVTPYRYGPRVWVTGLRLASIRCWPALDSAGVSPQAAKQTLKQTPNWQILLSTCGINPGDSGGPLLNPKGELIGVTFGIPRGGAEKQISLDKFSYHVHLDEVKAFLKNRPSTPEVLVPSPWPPAIFGDLQDRNGDGRWDGWGFSLQKGGNLTGLMLDLDQDSQPALKEQYITDPVLRKLWDFEFAYTFTSVERTFYDADNNGEVDLILTDVNGDGVADLVIQFEDETWTRLDVQKQRLLDATLFKDRKLGELMTKSLNLTSASLWWGLKLQTGACCAIGSCDSFQLIGD